MNRWVKVALVVLVGLVAVGLRWPFGGSSGPQTYTNDEYGFTLTYDGSITELPVQEVPRDETMFHPDFEVGFFDADGPAIEDVAADGLSVVVLEVGDAVTPSDPRNGNLDALALASLEASGNTDIGEVREIAMEGCSAAVAVESTDRYGRASLDSIGIAGCRMYWVVVYATAETKDDIWTVLTEAVDTFAVTDASTSPAPAKTHVEPDGTFSLTCDRRFIRVGVDEQQQEGFSQPLGLSDPLSGVDAEGIYRDGIIVSVQDLGVEFTEADQRRFLKDMASGLDTNGWRLVAGPEEMEIDGAPAFRFEARLPDESVDAIYAVLSGTSVYFVECYAQKATWTTVKPLFDDAARSLDVK